MLAKVRSLLRVAWPFVGSLYLGYLALQAPPVRYVGLIGLVFVVPLIVGWVVGRVLGVGPWAADTGDPADPGDTRERGDPDDPAETSDSSEGRSG